MGSDRVVATIQLPTFWNCCNNCVFINVVVVFVLCGKSSLCVKSKHDCTRHWSWFTYHPPPPFSHFAKPILSPLGAVYNWFATYPYFVFGFFVFVVENCIWMEKHDQHFVSRHWQWMNGMNANQSTSQWVSEPSRHQPAATDNIWQWQWQWLFVCCKRRKKENTKSIDTQGEREREREEKQVFINTLPLACG